MNSELKLKKYMRFLRLFVKGVFNNIDRELNPEVSVVKFNKNVKGYEFELLPEYHETNIDYKFNSNLDLRKFIEEDEYKKHCDAIFSNYDFEKEKLSFYSNPSIADDSVFLIRISIDKNVFSRHVILKKNKYSSFLETNIIEMIKEINNANDTLSNGKKIVVLDYKEIIRKAAKLFISDCLGMNMLNDIFNQINDISSVYYESNTSKGKIVFTSENFIYDNHPNIEKILMLKEKVLLKNKRLVRKLLEICNNDVSLLSDGKYVYGICRLIGNYNDELEDIFIAEYLDVYSWQLLYSNKKLFKVDYEKVYLPQNKITYSEFKRRMGELFKNLSSEKIGKLYSVIIEAVKQKHGTMIIISKNARSETERLKSQAFRVDEKEITPSIVKEITSIDGAVLIDTECKCYGIGVILDGMASNNGNTARGARYNSAIRYVETIKNKENFSDCLAVVISEDGYVDLISRYTIDIMGGIFNGSKKQT